MGKKIKLTIYILMIIFESVILQTWALTDGEPNIGSLLTITLFLIYFIYLSVECVIGE